jgi:hypothetical protein
LVVVAVVNGADDSDEDNCIGNNDNAGSIDNNNDSNASNDGNNDDNQTITTTSVALEGGAQS